MTQGQRWTKVGVSGSKYCPILLIKNVIVLDIVFSESELLTNDIYKSSLPRGLYSAAEELTCDATTERFKLLVFGLSLVPFQRRYQ